MTDRDDVISRERELVELLRENIRLRRECEALRHQVARLLPEPAMRFLFIAGHTHQFSVKRMIDTLGVSRSGFYKWRGR